MERKAASKKVQVSKGKTEYLSFCSLGKTVCPPASTLKGCKSLDLSGNPLVSLESLETIPTLTQLNVSKTQLMSFIATKPQPALTRLWISGTPIASFAHVEIMCLCVFGMQLKYINGRLIKRSVIYAATELRDHLLPYLYEGWTLVGVSEKQGIMIWNDAARKRKVLPINFTPYQAPPVPELEERPPPKPQTKINFKRRSLGPAPLSRENRSENGEKRSKIPIPKQTKRRRSAPVDLDTCKSSDTCLSPSKSVESFTEIRDSEPVVIENSAMFPPIQSAATTEENTEFSDDDFLLEPDAANQSARNVKTVSLFENDDDDDDYKMATVQDLMAEMVQKRNLAAVDDCASVISCSTTASGLARHRFNFDEIMLDEPDNYSDLSDFEPCFQFADGSPRSKGGRETPRKSPIVRFA